MDDSSDQGSWSDEDESKLSFDFCQFKVAISLEPFPSCPKCHPLYNLDKFEKWLPLRTQANYSVWFKCIK
jgi:hypothetical protein